ncbi:GNAT family N-acetyltransferase [Lacrimispora sp. JR3]|uniref:GNAT family N-acetyltransferase n=1 Tax=Lacrimispora sinapis TaxID=3111456 RepID=UPI00374A4890
MNIIRTNSPTQTQKHDLYLLQDTCRNHDSISLTFPMEEDCIYYLLYGEEVLLSAISAFFTENQDYECSAFTAPVHRRKGYFVRLLKELLKETGETDLIFPVDETCPDTLAAIKAIEASFWYQEHIMELPPSQLFKTSHSKDRRYSDKLSLTIATSPEETPVQCVFLLEGSTVGSCFLDFLDHGTYFYGFEIAEPLRNQGLGTACLSLFLDTYFAHPNAKRFKKLFLQVSGLNEPALALYKKAGFQITETLSYYVY